MGNTTTDPGQAPDKDNQPSPQHSRVDPSPQTAEHESDPSLHTAPTSQPRSADNGPPAKAAKAAKRLPPYDWQLLSQGELERIAYNSRKQKKARLRADPPKCNYCPAAHFTSMAMLSTHLSSKKHLVRVKMQSEHRQQGPHGRSHESMHTEQAPGSSGEDTEMKDADQHEGPTMVNKEGDIGTGTDNTTSSSNDKGGRAAEGSSKLCGVRTPTAKQRRRKAERDRKKARARQGHALMDQDAPATDTTLPPANFDEFKPALKPISSGTPLTIASTDLISAPVSKEQFESSAVSSRVICTTDKPSEAKHPDSKTSTDTTNVPTQRWWDCSVCGSHWKKQRGWQGHLESAQHMRRLSQIMREIAPVMAPYGEGDVLASKDTFGWGTAVGAEEEEEEEEEEKDDEDNEDSKDMEMEDQKGAYDVENVAHDDMVLSD